MHKQTRVQVTEVPWLYNPCRVGGGGHTKSKVGSSVAHRMDPGPTKIEKNLKQKTLPAGKAYVPIELIVTVLTTVTVSESPPG